MRPVWILVAWLAALPAAAADDPPRRMAFSAPVTVAADGRAEVGPVEGIQGPLADVVRTELARLPYIQANHGGEPIASTVLVDGDVVLVPAGDEFEVFIEGLETQPRLIDWRPADYTAPLLRSRQGGTIALVLQVGADGHVHGSTVAHGKNSHIIAAAREAVADWRFQPPVEGQGFEVGAAFWFHGSWETPSLPDIPCTVPPQGAHLPDDDGCLRITETTGAVSVGRVPHVPHLVRPPAPPSVSGWTR